MLQSPEHCPAGLSAHVYFPKLLQGPLPGGAILVAMGINDTLCGLTHSTIGMVSPGVGGTAPLSKDLPVSATSQKPPSP